VPNALRKLRLAGLGIVLGVLAVAAVTRAVDPFRAWPWALIDVRQAALAPDPDARRSRLRTAYRLRIVQPHTLLVGSSRVETGMPVDPADPDMFNAGLPGASLAEIDLVVDTALHNPRLRRVVWALDFYAFAHAFAGVRDAELPPILGARSRSAFELRRLQHTLLSSTALWESIRHMARAYRTAAPPGPIAPSPWPGGAIATAIAAASGAPGYASDASRLAEQLRTSVDIFARYEPDPHLFALFVRTLTRLRAAGVEVILVVPPLSVCELEIVQQAGTWPVYQQWKRDVAAVSPFWDFAGVDAVAATDRFFKDIAHFTPPAGHLMLRRALALGCADCGADGERVYAAGRYVYAATIDAHLARDEAARTAGSAGDSHCRAFVAPIVEAITRPPCGATGPAG